MAVTYRVNTSHWCPECSRDREGDCYDASFYELSDTPNDQDRVDEDYVTYYEGWRCTYCDYFWTYDETPEKSGWECADCGDLEESWEEAANCCNWICHLDGDREHCACGEIDLPHSSQWDLLHGETLNTTFVEIAEDTGPETHYICLVCHDVVADKYRAHQCGQSKLDSFSDYSYGNSAWEQLVAYANEVTERLERGEASPEAVQVERVYREAPVQEQVKETLLDYKDQAQRPLAKPDPDCDNCDPDIPFCCTTHNTHKSPHAGCPQALSLSR